MSDEMHRLRYIAALREVIVAQELFYQTGQEYPVWWQDSSAESVERAAESELDSLTASSAADRERAGRYDSRIPFTSELK